MSLFFLILLAVVAGIAVTLQGQFMGLLDRALGTKESIFVTYAGGGLIIALLMLAFRGSNLKNWPAVPYLSNLADAAGRFTKLTNLVYDGRASLKGGYEMSGTVFWGIWGIGFVFGYLLYYAVRHTETFSIEMLSTAIGAVGSATVIGLVGNYQDWIGPYGLGLLAGFIFYFVLSLILIATGLFSKFANVGVLSKTLIGAPRD